jgi:hypothetical protein
MTGPATLHCLHITQTAINFFLAHDGLLLIEGHPDIERLILDPPRDPWTVQQQTQVLLAEAIAAIQVNEDDDEE